MIAVEGLTKRFADIDALTGVSFRVARQEVLGFLGPNAAGKTTTLRIITGFLPPDSGTVTVGGFRVPGQSLEVRRRVGYLPEHISLYRDMTVHGILDYLATLRDVPRRGRTAAVESAVEKCGLGPVRGRVVGELSRGYRQRVGLAQALVHDPEVLVLDEPTVGLDPKQIHEVRSLIKELGREHTILLSSHILSEVSATCGRVVIIHKGRVVAEDTTSGLAARLHGELTVTLEVRGMQDEVHELLHAFPEVTVVSTREREFGTVRAELRLPGDRAVRERLAHAIVDKGMGLLELSPGGASLEDVFLELTKEDTE